MQIHQLRIRQWRISNAKDIYFETPLYEVFYFGIYSVYLAECEPLGAISGRLSNLDDGHSKDRGM